jgi:hypothetical protein
MVIKMEHSQGRKYVARNERSVIVETINGTDNLGCWVTLMWNIFVVAWKFWYHIVTDECMSLKCWWNDADRGKSNCSKKVPSQYHFVHHKSHVNWRCDLTHTFMATYPPEPWHSPKFGTRKGDIFISNTHTQKKYCDASVGNCIYLPCMCVHVSFTRNNNDTVKKT